VRGDGDLHLRGTLSTSPEPTPGADGPDLDVHASGILVLEEGARLVAGDGRPGSAVEGLGLAEAGDGGHGGDVVLSAERVVTSGAGVVAGTGGDGGDATANGSPDARALAGDGGPAGRVLVHAPVVGVLDLTPGNGGDGGFADARGQDAPPCEGGEGEPATDNRSADPPGPDGSGASANASATAGGCGPWDGTGGVGGRAEARGGQGGTAPNGTGGDGGDATALGGRGGDGRDACFQTREEARAAGALEVDRAGNGGPGGGAYAYGGDGGPGVTGGAGGDALARTEGGDGGDGTQDVVRRGTGGINVELNQTFLVDAGDGGPGVNGGPGGSAVGESTGGSAGDLCRLPTAPGERVAEGAATAIVGLSVGATVAVSTTRQRRVDEG